MVSQLKEALDKLLDGRDILILVHPGSTCGSANFNLGQDLASASRRELVQDLQSWKGHFLVFDGNLSDELPRFKELNQAMLGCAIRTEENGFQALRINACDNSEYTQDDATLDIFLNQSIDRQTKIKLTGAWYNPISNDGCLFSVCEILYDLGYENFEVLDSAFSEDDLCVKNDCLTDVEDNPQA